ncbi:ROK family protein [Rubripirellula sp.]|nr:ROK family protein [Rubripirellula sp.]
MSDDGNGYLGIDVGGTTIKYGVCKGDGTIVSRQSIPTEALMDPEAVIRHGLEFADAALIRSKSKITKLAAVGLAVPGVLDTTSWCLREVVNLSHWTNRPLLEILNDETQLPSAVINDANAAALAEHQHRRLHQQSLALITLGTGIGCGLAIGDQELTGDHGCAGEIGHLTIDFSTNAPMCNCGQRGHLEAYAGAPAVIERAKEAFNSCAPNSIPSEFRENHFDPLSLATAAEEGYSEPRRVILETATYLGQAIGILGQVIDPEVVLLGGAMTFGGKDSEIGQSFLNAVRRVVKNTTLQQIGGQMKIDYASLGNTAGIIGAALVAKQKGRES